MRRSVSGSKALGLRATGSCVGTTALGILGLGEGESGAVLLGRESVAADHAAHPAERLAIRVETARQGVLALAALGAGDRKDRPRHRSHP